MTKRTQQEILDRIEKISKDDFFGFQTGDLINFLTFDNAKKWLKEGVTAEEWEPYTDPVERIKDYMPFAWDKANDCRGLSAGRSIEHMKAWLWLDGKEELADKMESLYEYYGKPCLRAICVEYGIDWKALDNNEWVNSEYDNPKTAEEALA
jgi:hypothetical protein